MHWFQVIAFLAALQVTLVSGRVMDSLPAIPRGWSLARRASPDDLVKLKIALRQSQAKALADAVLDMSTPGHPNYGLHMSLHELRSLTAPSKETTENVTEWLKSHDIDTYSQNNDFITLSTTVRAANALLDTAFDWYQFGDDGLPVLRALQYSLPDHIASHVKVVQPTTRFGNLSKMMSSHGIRIVDPDWVNSRRTNQSIIPNPKSCRWDKITPKCLRDLYNVNYTATATPGSAVAFASFLDEVSYPSDMEKFIDTFMPEAKGTLNFTRVVGGGASTEEQIFIESSEANLDSQYLFAIARPLPLIEFCWEGWVPLVPTPIQPGPDTFNEPYLQLFEYLLSLPDSELPKVLSISYAEEEQSIPLEYSLVVCDQIMLLAARGVSVIAATGDSGAGYVCIRASDNATWFEPNFPATCPWVTSVGATRGINPEKAMGFSQGGFSDHYPRPIWQDRAIPSYLAQIGNTYSRYFNASGRGFPDVAAQGDYYQVYDKGSLYDAAGTSASAPVFAGMIGLLNAARKTIGLPPLGFLNPMLYVNQASFTDIKDGRSKGCKQRSWNWDWDESINRGFEEWGRTGAKWNATVGWDPVTGLGTPLFDKLLAVVAPGVPNA